MSERKVLNKYYPPDFDPTKLIKLKLPKQRQYTVRIMTPFNMRCNTCGDYIAKAKKFNARKETIESEQYLTLKVFRFYIKCPKCMSEITFKTNPETCDYEMEFGAQRSFDALRLAELQEKAEIDKEKEEEKLNPMKLLENRTKQSREEMEELERLQQIKEENVNKEGLNIDNLFDEAENSMREKLIAEEKLKKEEEEDNLMVETLLKESINLKNQKNNLLKTEIKNPVIQNSNDKKRKIESLITLKKKKPVEIVEKPKLSLLCNYSSDSNESED